MPAINTVPIPHEQHHASASRFYAHRLVLQIALQMDFAHIALHAIYKCKLPRCNITPEFAYAWSSYEQGN